MCSSARSLVYLCVCVCLVPVCRCGEHPQDDVPAVHTDDGAGGVEQVKVEVGIAGHRAVQPRFQERRPLLLQDALGSSQVALAHARHARHHHLRGVGHREAEVGVRNDRMLL